MCWVLPNFWPQAKRWKGRYAGRPNSNCTMCIYRFIECPFFRTSDAIWLLISVASWSRDTPITACPKYFRQLHIVDIVNIACKYSQDMLTIRKNGIVLNFNCCSPLFPDQPMSCLVQWISLEERLWLPEVVRRKKVWMLWCSRHRWHSSSHIRLFHGRTRTDVRTTRDKARGKN